MPDYNKHILSIHDWWQAVGDKPPLLVGKGPTFDRIEEVSLGSYCTIGLNHVNDPGVDSVSCPDSEAIFLILDQLEKSSTYLLTCWAPLEKNRSSERTIVELCEQNAVLAQMALDGRIVAANYALGSLRDNGPVIPMVSRSASWTTYLLALAGARSVYSIGVDGGSSYSNNFTWSDATKEYSFDQQFVEIAQCVLTHDIDYRTAFGLDYNVVEAIRQIAMPIYRDSSASQRHALEAEQVCAKLRDEIHALQSRLSVLENDVATLTNEKADLAVMMANDRMWFQGESSKLEVDLTRVNRELAAVNDQKAALEREAEILERDKAQLFIALESANRTLSEFENHRLFKMAGRINTVLGRNRPSLKSN